MGNLEFVIPDMSCGGCAGAVERVCARVDPAARVSVELPTKTATVESAAPWEAFAKALAEADYPPKARAR